MDSFGKSKNRKIVILLVIIISIVLIFLALVVGIGKGAFTGFFGLNENQESQNENSFITGNAISSPENTEEDLNKVNDLGNKIFHAPNVVILNNANNYSNITNTTKTTTRSSRRGRGGGGNPNPIPTCTSNSFSLCYDEEVYWYDSCNERESIKTDCNSTQTCFNGGCVDIKEEDICEINSFSSCYNNDVYWYNSCNQREAIRTDCNSTQNCFNGACIDIQTLPSCTSNSFSACYNEDVYWYNSCNLRTSKKQDCNSTQTCFNGGCVDIKEEEICEINSFSACYKEDVYWYNSCNLRTSVKENCNSNQTCLNGGCVNISSVTLAKKLKRIPTRNNLYLKRNGLNVYDNTEFEGRVRFNLEKSGERISDFDVVFEEDVDLSGIVADSDPASGKVFMHSSLDSVDNVVLYVTVDPSDVAIVVCSNASNFEEVSLDCSEDPQVTKRQIIYLDDPRLTKTGEYTYSFSVTGTGAMGVNLTELNSTTANATAPGNITAIAGNITEIIMPDSSGVTQAWQGYFGNITGTIMLADNNDNIMYNWSVASPEGVILASVNNSIVWNNIQCFNFTAAGNYTSEEGRGETNLFGTNLTQLESAYGLDSDDLDGVDETFTLIGLGTHNLFYINNNEFEEGECYNTRIFDSSGSGVDDHFEEAILYEPTTFSVVFASILNEDVSGFDNNPHDFEILVLEDGHGTDLDTTTYYFWAEMY